MHQKFKYINELGGANTPFLFIIDFLKENLVVKKLDEINPDELLYTVEQDSNVPNNKIPEEAFHFSKNPVSLETYKKGYNQVISNLKNGNSYLTNYTTQTPITTNLNLLDIFYRSKAKYKLWYQNNFVVFSPETFIKIIGNKIYSYPMKGTINANEPNAKNKILANPKEMAEHATITDLIRNDLSRVATNVQVNKYRYIDRLKTNQSDLLQVSSVISGTLPENYAKNLGTILNSLLPAGSISGAPKIKTLEIIKTAENYNRGFYTGVFGIYNSHILNCAVMIRFIEKIKDQLFFKSGGGITIHSQLKSEYQEMIDKIYLPF